MADTNNQDDLLIALESIKGLLEQSESKLQAAQKSIGAATPEIFDSVPDEEIDVPVLEDIVVHAEDGGSRVDIELLKAFLDEMQKKIEKSMRDTLMKAVVQAEGDVKKQLRAYLNQLRKMLDN